MRVAALYVYPVKACAAVAVDDVAVSAVGLENDRRFAFVGDDGRALTQREHPLLACIRPVLEADSLRLDFAGLLDFTIRLRDFTAPVAVDVWGQRIPGRAAPEDFLAYVGQTARLVILESGVPRSFSDSQPVLVTTTAMLGILNAKLREPVGMERFRPNVVLEGAMDWTALKGERVLLERTKPCARCEVTTIDQTSGARRGPEPLRTLSERFDGNFGIYCRVTRPGRLRRGESLAAS